MRPGSPIIQIRGVEGAGLGGADLPNCYFGGVSGPAANGSQSAYVHAIGFLSEAGMDTDEGPSTQPFSGTGLPDFDGSRWDDESCTGVSVRSSYPGSIFSGSNVGKQFTLSPGFTRSASAKRESHFLSILEYEAHQSFAAETQKGSETWSRPPSERSPVLRRASMDASASASLAPSQDGSVANYSNHSRLKSPTLKSPTWSRPPSQMDASASPPLKSGTVSRAASQTSLAPSQNGSVANYGHHSRSKSPRRGPVYSAVPGSSANHPPSTGFTRSHSPRKRCIDGYSDAGDDKDDDKKSIAESTMTGFTSASRRTNVSTCPSLAHIEYLGVGSQAGSIMLANTSGSALIKGLDVSCKNFETSAFVLGSSPNYMINQPKREHLAPGTQRGMMPEAYSTSGNACPVSYTQMMGDCPNYVLNGLTSPIMGFI